MGQPHRHPPDPKVPRQHPTNNSPPHPRRPPSGLPGPYSLQPLPRQPRRLSLPHNPRVLWIGLNGDLAPLAQIQASVEEHCCALGLDPDRRPFTPHLTLGRVRRSLPTSQRDLVPPPCKPKPTLEALNGPSRKSTSSTAPSPPKARYTEASAQSPSNHVITTKIDCHYAVEADTFPTTRGSAVTALPPPHMSFPPQRSAPTRNSRSGQSRGAPPARLSAAKGRDDRRNYIHKCCDIRLAICSFPPYDVVNEASSMTWFPTISETGSGNRPSSPPHVILSAAQRSRRISLCPHGPPFLRPP